MKHNGRIKEFAQREKSSGKRDKTIEKYASCLRRMSDGILDSPPQKINDWLYNQGYKPSVLYMMVMATKAYLKSVSKHELAEKIKIPKYRSVEKILYLNGSQIKNLLNVCNEQEYMVVKLFLETGLRNSTVRELKIKDFDWEKSIINIPSSYEGNKGKVFLSKPITNELKKILIRHIEREKKREHSYIFNFGQTDKSKPQTKTWRMTWFISKAGKKAGIPWLTPHILRHTYATHYYKITRDILSLKKALGHRSSASSERYAHIAEKEKETLEKLNKEGLV